jgi:hypothetical protein
VAVPPLVYGAIECRLQPPDPLRRTDADLVLVDVGGRTVIRRTFLLPRDNPLTILCLEAGTYFLRLTPRWSEVDWCAQWFDQADAFAGAAPILVPPNGGVARVTMVLSTCGTLAGRVLKSDGSPAGGRRVELFAADDPSQGAESSPIYTVTDRDTGEFSLQHLHDGDYRIGVRYTLTTLVWYAGTLAWDEAQVLTLDGYGESTGLEWSLVE